MIFLIYILLSILIIKDHASIRQPHICFIFFIVMGFFSEILKYLKNDKPLFTELDKTWYNIYLDSTQPNNKYCGFEIWVLCRR